MEKETVKKKILIIDDNVNLTGVLVDKFTSSGFEALGAYDGEDGLKKALEFRPEIILLDIVMPKMDGLEMLKKLREDEWGGKVKVIILTALGEASNIATAMESKVTSYLIKTDYSLDQIVKNVQERLEIS